MITANKKMIQIIVVLGLLLGLLTFGASAAQAAYGGTDVNIYFFWGQGCPHCAQAKPVLEEIVNANPKIGMYDYDLYTNQEYTEIFFAFGAALDFEPQYVPTIIIGERYWVGYSEDYRQEIIEYINFCLESGCPDPGGEVLAGFFPSSSPTSAEPTATPDVRTTPTDEPVSSPTPSENGNSGKPGQSITLPLIGTIDLTNRSILISTVLISLVDGFNPCSVWVLSMLLAITLNTRSRKKVLLIGFVFIFVTGLIYALFIGGLFTVFKIVSFVGWIQIIVAVVAFIFGLINIKDYFWFKEGVSLTISDKKKPGIYKGIRRVLNAEENIWAMILGTIVLAAGVSLVEFSCTAGFPVLWTNLLSSQGVTGLAFIGFLLVYMIIYQIDELGIFLVSVFTLRKSKFEEKHGRILKLIGGMLMLSLAVVMLIDPTIMNDLSKALWVFGAAFGMAALVLVVHRIILPKFNIQIGSEKGK